MPINLLAGHLKEPVNLLAKNESIPSFESLAPNEQDEAMELAKQQISSQFPNMPDWMRDAILKITPKDSFPMLESVSRGITNVTNNIPVAAGGLLQGASIPIRGVSGLIPTEFTQKLANSPDLTTLFPKAEGGMQEGTQLASELLGGGGLLGKMLNSVKGASQLARVPQSLQEPLALATTGALATPGSAKNRALGASGALALGGATNLVGKGVEKVANKLPSFVKGLMNESTPESLVQAVQKPHDKLQSTADELYSQVRQGIKKRDIKIPVKDKYLNQISEILPKTRASQKLIEKAKTGDYEAIHDLQSHLYKKGTKGLSSDDISLNNQGEEILDLRDKLNDDLESHLLKEGHADIAHVLKQGKKTYAELKNTYYAPNLKRGISKMVQSDLRLIPKNPEKLFDENSVPMTNFLSKHPDAAKHAKGIMDKEKAKKSLNKIFIGTGLGGGTLSGGKFLYDLFK